MDPSKPATAIAYSAKALALISWEEADGIKAYAAATQPQAAPRPRGIGMTWCLVAVALGLLACGGAMKARAENATGAFGQVMAGLGLEPGPRPSSR